MKLTPQQAPLYGKCLITVQLCDEELVEDEEEGVEFYLLFVGSTQSHLTSTLRSGHDTLQALCPAHDCCEAVRVTLCSSRPAGSAGSEPLAEHAFSFIQDLAFDMAQFLVSTAGRQDGLEGALLLDECQIPVQECERLDQSLALALHHLTLPQGWSLLGRTLTNSTEPEPQETLLHFAARRGLRRVAGFLLLQPGAREALRLPNKQGLTPACISQQRGHRQLHELLTRAETDTETDRRTENLPPLPPTDARVECHLPSLNTHTLTLGRAPGADPPDLRRAVEQLRHLICHLYAKGVPSLQLQSESLHTTQECCESSETEQACLRRPRQPDSPDTLAQGCEKESDGERTDGGPSLAPSTSERLPDNGQGVTEDRVCLDPNRHGDYHKAEEKGEEEGGEEKREEAGGGVVDWKSVSDCSDKLQGQPEGESCGNDQEETDTDRAVISVTLGTTEGTDQEGDDRTAEGEDGKHSGHTDQSALAASAMGHTQSLENSEISESSDSDMKESFQEDMDAQSDPDHCNTPHVEEDERESEGLVLPDPSPNADASDVIQEVTSEAGCPHLTIGGLRASSGTNSSEQSQETAVGDYSTDKQQGDCPDVSRPAGSETHRCSEQCAEKEMGCSSLDVELGSDEESESADVFDQGASTISDINTSHLPLSEPAHHEENSLDHLNDSSAVSVYIDSVVVTKISNCRPSPVTMIISGNGRCEGDSGTALSSDEEDAFRSFNSSLTEIFHLSEDADRANSEVEQDGFKMAEEQDLLGTEEDTRDLGFPLEQSGDVLTVTNCEEASAALPGAEPECCPPSPGHHTMEPLISEVTSVSRPEPFLEKPSLKLVSAGSGTEQPVEISVNPHLTANITESHSGLKVVEELSPAAVLDGSEATVTDEEEAQPPETSLRSEVVSGEESTETHLPSDLRRSSEHKSKVTTDAGCDGAETDERSALSNGQPAKDEDLNLSGPPRLDDVTVDLAAPTVSAGVFSEDLASSGNLVSEELSTEEVVPDVTTERVEEAPQNPAETPSHPISPQEVVVSVAEDMVDGQAEHATTIHRDKQQAAYPLALSPCEQTPNSDATDSPPSVRPSVSSATSSTYRDSGSDTESFFSTEAGEDCVFRKGGDSVTGGDSTSEVSVSCSSTDDTASVGPASSSPESCVEGPGQRCSWSPEESSETGAFARGGGGGGGGGGETEEEAKDRLTEVPRRSTILRPSIRSLSPFRRHSWGPGKGATGEADMNQRSSIRSPGQGKPTFHRRSYSLEGLLNDDGKNPSTRGAVTQEPFLRGVARQHSEERGSLVSLTEEHESDLGERGGLEGQKSRRYRPLRHSCPPMTLPLTKSVSMLAISQRETDAKPRVRHKRKISLSFKLSPILSKSNPILSVDSLSSEDEEDDFSMRSFSSASGSLAYSISEEEPGPLRTDSEGKSGTKVSRTFSYLKSKMYKKSREKEGGKSRDKEREAKEREKRTLNGHLFTIVNSAHLRGPCHQCNKAINTKEAFLCTNCNAHVHKACRENLPVCAKVKMKLVVSDSSTLPVVTLRAKPTGIRERPRSAILCPEDHPSLVLPSRRHTSIMPFGHGGNLSKSISISNIAGGTVFDDIPIKGLRYLSQSTDSLHKNNLVNESTESLTDEGTEMMDSQLMGEFEAEVKDLEADSWTFTVEESYLRQLDKDVIKRQDVIYELIQTEMHHVRTLRIMAEVYSKGLQKEVQLEGQTVERVLPVLDELLELHTHFFARLLERKRDSQQEGEHGGLAIHRIADVLVNQFSGSNAECMKRVYGKFCSRHNEATNFYKELLTKDKRFQAFIKKKMSSSIVRRLGIPECILLVTQRITKYPVLMQRILQHTNEEEEDHADLTEALRLVKEVLAAVDSKVNEHEKKKRLKDIYSRTDSKSIMRMKSGQMFAREDLVRGRRLIHDGPLQLKNTQGRLKDVTAMLLSDIFVFLQEKDQKYVFASLDQRATVISLQKLIVREVANEERGLFLITAGIEKPEMVEVLASTKEERNTWMQLIQDAMHSMEKDEDEGIPSETEEDRRQLETKAKEMRDMLRKKDDQILGLLEEKMKVFRDMCECGGAGVEEPSPRTAVLFRASRVDVPRGEPIMKDALQEVETLQALVNGSLGGAVSMGQQQVACAPEAAAGAMGPVCLPRRAETFGGFDSHQMNISKNGDKEEDVDAADLRRTESDSVLKKGGHANLLLLLKRNSEQVLHSVTHLHDLLNTLQAVVVQQDTFIEDQRQALTDRPPSASSSASSSRASSRPNSLIEQEKQRSLEKHRQEMAALQRQQTAHADEKRRREREWDLREQQLTDREVLVHVQEEETGRRRRTLEEERQELQARKEDYQKDLERLRDAQRKLDRDRETVLREMERMEQLHLAQRMQRTPSSTSEDSLAFLGGSGGLSLEPAGWAEPGDAEQSSPPRPETKSKAKSLNPFAVRSSAGQSSENQMPNRLLQLARPKDKKEKKKKKKDKGQVSQAADSSQHLPEPALDGEIFFC